MRAELVGDGASTKMRAILTDVPSTLSWRVSIPSGGRLETHLSFARSEIVALGRHACQAQVEAAEGGAGVHTVLSARELSPASHWEPFVVDLSPLGGRTIDLRLRLDCPGAVARTRAGAARWSVPVITTPRGDRDRNVLLITIDTLRADHLGSYGYSRPTSPNIDDLARRGVLFEHAETVQSATWPALTSLHTSLHPSAHGVVWNGQRFPEGLTTLAEVLHANQYSTSAFITNMTRGRHPGFSRLYLSRRGGQAVADRTAVDQARAQLLLEKDRQFFMWVHLLSPHADYDPPLPHNTFTRPRASSVKAQIDALANLRRRRVTLTPEDVAHVVGLYDGEIAYADAQVGRLLATLRELDLEKNTLVVLTADHGEDLYEHHRLFLPFAVPLWLFHADPAGVRAARGPARGSAWPSSASLVDVAPTVVDFLGLPAVEQFRGENLLPGGRPPFAPIRRAVFGETQGLIHSLRSKEWRFIRNPSGLHPEAPGGPYPIADVELYDLRTDPQEIRNLAALRPEIVRALDAELHSFRARHLRMGFRPPEIDPEAAEELRALGYLSP